MKMDVYLEDKDPVGDASYRYRATAYLPREISRARMVFRGHSDVSGAHAGQELLAGLLDLKIVEDEHDLTVVHDDTAAEEAEDQGPAPRTHAGRAAGSPATPEAARPREALGSACDGVLLRLLRDAVVKETMIAMRAYVVAARDDSGEAWQTKDEAQGAVEVLLKLARGAGLVLDIDELDAEAKRALEQETASLLSEAPRTILEIKAKARRIDHAPLTQDDTTRLHRAEEALRYGPYVLRYLAGEDVERY